jgi:hypothetical protein
VKVTVYQDRGGPLRTMLLLGHCHRAAVDALLQWANRYRLNFSVVIQVRLCESGISRLDCDLPAAQFICEVDSQQDQSSLRCAIAMK